MTHYSKHILTQTFPSRVEAEVAKQMLATHGIDALVSVDDAGGMYPCSFSPGAQLLVRKKDRKKAIELLQ